MKKLMYLLVFVLLWSCSDSNSLKPAEFQQRIKSTSDAVVIDVRTPKETYANGVIEGAVVRDYTGGEFAGAIDSLDISKTYFVYCASGKRSGDAAKLMKREGFEKVFVLEGGIKAWAKEGLDLQSRE